MAYLFPELARNDTYKYWGYADLDNIWGNISRFSHWFQPEANVPVVNTGWDSVRGFAAFYINEDWTTRFVQVIPLLLVCLYSLYLCSVYLFIVFCACKLFLVSATIAFLRITVG